MTTLAERRQAREVAAIQPAGDVIEEVLIRGDLKALTSEQRNQYYLRLCQVTGLNPLTQPFEYLTLNNKLVLYARKACTDQLRALHKVSVVDMDQEERDGIYTVTVKVQNAEGRTDMDNGSVNIGGLKGEARANAIMKASTKAKRRATLSICGLGLLDETEIETIPVEAVERQAVTNPDTGRQINPNNARNSRDKWARFEEKVRSFTDLGALESWWADASTQAAIDQMPWAKEAAEEYEKKQEALLQAGRP